MGLEEEAVKGLFSGLPVWARHSVSLAIIGAVAATCFFTFVQQPLAQAAIADVRQDGAQSGQQTAIERLTEIVAALQQSNALLTQAQGVQERATQDNARRLDRIEDKIDRLRQGR